MDLDICGVEQHPITARNTVDYYCQTVLHHLTNQQYDRIRQHLNRQFSGVLGIGFNDWSQAIGPLGFVVKVVGEGTGSAHAEIIPLWVSEFGWGSQK